MSGEIENVDQGSVYENRAGRIIDPFEYKEIIDGKEVIREGVIRYATKEDLGGLVRADQDRAEFRRKVYDVRKNGVLVVKTKADIEKKMNQNLEKSFSKPDELAFIVLEIDGEIAGYIELGKFPNLPPDVIQANTVSILEKYQGKSVGKALVLSTEAEAKRMGAEKIELYTNDQNIQTVGDGERVGFYENLGYQREGESTEDEENTTWSGKPIKHIKFVKYFNKKEGE